MSHGRGVGGAGDRADRHVPGARGERRAPDRGLTAWRTARTFVVVGAGLCGATAVGDAPGRGVRRPDRADRRGGATPRTNGRRCRRSTCAASSRSSRSSCGRPSGTRSNDVELRIGTRVAQLDGGDRRSMLAGGERVRVRRAPRGDRRRATGGSRCRAPSCRACSTSVRAADADRIRAAAVAGGGARRVRRHGVHRRRGRRVAADAGVRGHGHRDLRDRAVPCPRRPTSGARSRRSIATTA